MMHNFLQGRPGFSNRPARIVSSDRVLFTGRMDATGGRLKGRVDRSEARLPDWRAPLRIELSTPTAGESGIAFGPWGLVDANGMAD